MGLAVAFTLCLCISSGYAETDEENTAKGNVTFYDCLNIKVYKSIQYNNQPFLGQFGNFPECDQ